MLEKLKNGYINGFTIPSVIENKIYNLLAERFKILPNTNFEIEAFSAPSRLEIVKRIQSLFEKKGYVSYIDNEIFYASYYLPLNMYKIWKPLSDLSHRSLLKAKIKVLEIGAGPGTSTLGLIDYYIGLADEDSNTNYEIRIDIVEKQKKFIDILISLVNEIIKILPKNLSVKINQIFNIELENNFDFLGNNKYNLIYASNFYNMNEKFGKTFFESNCGNLKNFLIEKSSLIIIEPGKSDISVPFKKLCNILDSKKILHIFSPCDCLHDYENHVRCEQFSKASVNINSEMLTFLQKIGLKNSCITSHAYDYVVFRNDSIKKYAKDYKKRTKLKDIDWNQINNRVNIRANIITVIKNDKLGLMLCDGTVQNKVWLNLAIKDVKKHDLGNLDLAKGEKIDIIGAKIFDKNKLVLENDSVVEVSY